MGLILKNISNIATIPERYRAHHQLLLAIQTQLAKSFYHVVPRHLWIFEPEKTTTPGNIRRDSTKRNRSYKYAGGVFLVIKHRVQRPMTHVASHSKVEHSFKIDLAETIRLGEFLRKKDSADNFPFEHFYLPKSGDVYEWNGSLYEISEITGIDEGWYEPIQRFIVWGGEAGLLKKDSADIKSPLEVIGTIPEISDPYKGNKKIASSPQS